MARQRNDSTHPWFALHVRSNQERVVETILREKGYPAFLPLYRTRSRRRDKALHLDLPLFPGYVFAQFSPRERGPIVTISPVVRIVGSGKIPVPVDPVDINSIRAIVDSDLPYEPWPYVTRSLQIGDGVRICYGPLYGLGGVLAGKRGNDRVVVSVDLIMRSVAVHVNRSWLLPNCIGGGSEQVLSFL